MITTYIPYRNELALPSGHFNALISIPRKLATVEEALSWERGVSTESQKLTITHKLGEYKIGYLKPGKEFDVLTLRHKEGRLSNNPNDMRPIILKNDNILDVTQSFSGIFEELQSLGRQDAFALELLACLLFRAAFMLDHYYDEELNIWRYFPAENIINSIESKTKKIHGMPLSVYLRYLDAIALNEDVKYSTLGYDITKGTGRQNNLLTCVNIIGVFLNKVSIAKFAGNFARPPVGIAAISTKMAKEIFPLLNPELPLPLF